MTDPATPASAAVATPRPSTPFRQYVRWLFNIRSAIESLRGHKLRTGLTVLGIVFGVGAVIGMQAIGAGAQQEALELIDLLGVNNIIVRSKEIPDQEITRVREKSLGLNLRDLDSLLAGVPGADLVVGRKQIYIGRWMPKPAGEGLKLIGTSAGYADLLDLKIREGRWFTRREEAGAEPVCVLGNTARRALFGFGPVVGKQLKADSTWLTVIGVVESRLIPKSKFQGLTLQDVNLDAYLPLNSALKRYHVDWKKNQLDEVYIRIGSDTDVREAAVLTRSLMMRQHRGEEDFSVVVPEALLAQAQQTQRIFNFVMGTIAGISLLVGGIGIMNIMLATVLERTREIGIRRSVGARARDIYQQFVTEAVLIAVGGGMLGIALGFGLSEGVGLFAGWRTSVTPGSIALAFGVSVAIGIAFGSYPAYRAAQLNPVDALHYE